ncbi:protein of unknown function [Candidatus Nitrospira inopinata]|uniref:Uncharacterized protein n=1 Tax=Candidatus Nitrospira inopinata TaxID=1715989 RepID=A0A0S4KST4_9BACT|nr:protein of unknown function [Candidatus Nitrospira inopinata]
MCGQPGMFKASFVFVVLDCCLDMLLKDVSPTVVFLNAKLNLEKAAASLPCARKKDYSRAGRESNVRGADRCPCCNRNHSCETAGAAPGVLLTIR